MSEPQSVSTFVEQCRSYLAQIEASPSRAEKIRLLAEWADYMARTPLKVRDYKAAAGKDE